MEHISNVILVILSFLCPRKLAIAIFRKTKFINKIIDVYAQKESFFYVKKYKILVISEATLFRISKIPSSKCFEYGSLKEFP